MNKSKLLGWTLAVTLCVGCGQKEVTGKLERAEILMHEHPDSALTVLQELGRDRIMGASRKARYALLYSQALDKNYIDVDNDSLVRVAVDYYRRHGDAHEKALAYFYLGRVYDNAGDETQATEAFVEAETHALKTDDHYICGLIYSYLGNLYFAQYSFDEALDMYDKSEKCYSLAGQLRNEGYMVEAKARVYKLQQDWDKSLNEYHKAEKIFLSLNDKERILSINRAKTTIQFLSGQQIDLTTESLKQLYKDNKIDTLPDEDYPLWSMILMQNNKVDEARQYALTALELKDNYSLRQFLGLYALLMRIELNAKNYDQAFKYSSLYSNILESINKHERANLIQNIEKRYKNWQLQDALVYERNYRLYQLQIGLLIAFLGLSAVVIIITNIIKRKRRIISEKNREIESYRAMADDLGDNYQKLQDLYEKLSNEQDYNDEAETRFLVSLENRMKGLGDLLEEAYLFEKKPERFLKTFKNYIKESTSKDFAFSDLKYIVNKKYYGIIDYLRNGYPDLTESDLDLCSMICFGFSSNSIRQIYAHTNPDSIYNKRSKLRSKLKLDPSIQIEGFIRNVLAELSQKKATY